ncbi:hypothetical protein GIB67_028715 [Kingdonia uniflora]|uniref:DUF8039 domain-containing protein n=1 Tax=Kingdonia uniflora TaxID=39325 RepID=A0A7J7N9W4_9MAGN|nr:hypothetical protein GIB67_028715 [Kingdonia uniflora]
MEGMMLSSLPMIGALLFSHAASRVYTSLKGSTKVDVTNVVIPLFLLWRATDDVNTIGGALKSFIAWPKKYVVMKDN